MNDRPNFLHAVRHLYRQKYGRMIDELILRRKRKVFLITADAER